MHTASGDYKVTRPEACPHTCAPNTRHTCTPNVWQVAEAPPKPSHAHLHLQYEAHMRIIIIATAGLPQDIRHVPTPCTSASAQQGEQCTRVALLPAYATFAAPFRTSHISGTVLKFRISCHMLQFCLHGERHLQFLPLAASRFQESFGSASIGKLFKHAWTQVPLQQGNTNDKVGDLRFPQPIPKSAFQCLVCCVGKRVHATYE
eukprot:1158488-Pelagomonas_calceolata.AAC.1